MFPDWLTGFPYSVMHSLNLDWLLKKVASVDPSKFVQSVNNDFRPDPATGNLTLSALNIGALPENGTAVNSARLGGKFPGYYTTPENVLDNSDFRNPVNQRMRSIYEAPSGAPYNIDRWYANRATITVGVDGIVVSRNTTASTSATYFGQKLENASRFVGLPMTGVFMTNKGLFVGSFTFTGEDVVIASAHGWTVAYTKTTAAFIIQTSTETDITIAWAALYKGEYTAETLPPYIPKEYSVELLRCQHYFLRIVCTNTPVGFGHAFTDSAIRILMPTPTTMSTMKSPSITFYDNNNAVVAVSVAALIATAGQNLSPIAIAASGVARENGIFAICTVNGATAYETADLYCNGVVEISVEL